jgi:imidazoleglycerol-phosphate dehydratase
VSTILRETRETRVRVRVGPDALNPGAAPGRPAIERGTYAAPAIRTGNRFLDHMLETLARYSGLALDVEATGDLRHHLVEDVAITIGLALRDEIPATCQRYGDAMVVMDDALVQAALDVGGRAYYRGPVPSRLYDHFFRSLADNAAIALHLRVLRGRDRHHAVEAAFKAFGLALRRALAPGDAVFSTKGAIRIERLDPPAHGQGDAAAERAGQAARPAGPQRTPDAASSPEA